MGDSCQQHVCDVTIGASTILLLVSFCILLSNIFLSFILTFFADIRHVDLEWIGSMFVRMEFFSEKKILRKVSWFLCCCKVSNHNLFGRAFFSIQLFKPFNPHFSLIFQNGHYCLKCFILVLNIVLTFQNNPNLYNELTKNKDHFDINLKV